jgi:hypothetical protein
VGGVKGKGKDSEGEEDWKHATKIHQTLFEKGEGRRRGKWKYNGGDELVQSIL